MESYPETDWNLVYMKRMFPDHLNVAAHNQLMKELSERVRAKLATLPEQRIWSVQLKLVILPLAFFSLYVLALVQSIGVWLFMLLYVLMGVTIVLIFANLIHELCHGNVFRHKSYNEIAYHLFDLIGANSYIWKKRHLILHHKFPNVNDWDSDVEQSGPIIVFPSDEQKRYTRFQHIYFFALYPLFMLNWVLIRDFRDYFDSSRIVGRSFEIPTIEYVKLFFFKALNITMYILIPWLVFGYSFWVVLAAFVLLTISGSLVAMLVLLTPHTNEGNAFPLNEHGLIHQSWFSHQVEATNDVHTSNWFTRVIMGNFNYHLIHHLFPGISHVYTPEATAVMVEYFQEKGIPYKSYSLWDAVKKHYQLIKKNARYIDTVDL